MVRSIPYFFILSTHRRSETPDEGPDMSVKLIGTDSSDVTLINDASELGVENNGSVSGDEYFYVSSNEEVVKISSDGVLNAVGKGTAEITVYSVIAGSRYESAPVVITVSDDGAAFQRKI